MSSASVIVRAPSASPGNALPVRLAVDLSSGTGGAASKKRARREALPEHADYRDEGCDLSPSCLACPLPRCRYDEPGGARTMINRVRDEEISRLRFDAGMPVEDISRQFHVSRRTVFRVLQSRGPCRE